MNTEPTEETMPKEPRETLQNRLDHAAGPDGRGGGTVYTRGPVLGPLTIPDNVMLVQGREPETEAALSDHQRRWFAFLAARVKETELEAELAEKSALAKRAAARSLQAQLTSEQAGIEAALGDWPEAAQAYQVCREAELGAEIRLNTFIVHVLNPAKTRLDSGVDLPRTT